jgi:hypothetical protein
MKLLICIILQSSVTSSFLGPNSPICTLFSITFSLCFSLRMSDQVLHPHRTVGKAVILNVLKFTFLVGKYGRQRIQN